MKDILASVFLIGVIILAVFSFNAPDTRSFDGWVVRTSVIEVNGCTRTTLLLDVGYHDEIHYFEGNYTWQWHDYVSIKAVKEMDGPCAGLWIIESLAVDPAGD